MVENHADPKLGCFCGGHVTQGDHGHHKSVMGISFRTQYPLEMKGF